MKIESPPDLNTIAYIYGPLYQEVISYERILELDEQYNEVMTTVTSCLQNHTTFPIESAQRLDSILMAYFKRICLSKISEITKKSEEALKAISFASLLAVPGAITVLPSIVKTAKSYKLNIIPESVVSQFGI